MNRTTTSTPLISHTSYNDERDKKITPKLIKEGEQGKSKVFCGVGNPIPLDIFTVSQSGMLRRRKCRDDSSVEQLAAEVDERALWR